MEEALKMRNLLQEFLTKHDGVRHPSILGLREHIFTGRYFSTLSGDVCLFENFYFSLSQIIIICFTSTQCFFSGVVYVKSGDKFCDYWPEIIS